MRPLVMAGLFALLAPHAEADDLIGQAASECIGSAVISAVEEAGATQGDTTKIEARYAIEASACWARFDAVQACELDLRFCALELRPDFVSRYYMAHALYATIPEDLKWLFIGMATNRKAERYTGCIGAETQEVQALLGPPETTRDELVQAEFAQAFCDVVFMGMDIAMAHWLDAYAKADR